MRTVAALCLFGLGTALLVIGLGEAAFRALDFDRSRLSRAAWTWFGLTWFGAVTVATIEAIFHTLGVPLS